VLTETITKIFTSVVVPALATSIADSIAPIMLKLSDLDLRTDRSEVATRSSDSLNSIFNLQTGLTNLNKTLSG
jgi:hypothetical protein